MRIIYDTNILLQILRSSGSMGILQDMFGSEYVEEYISVVTVAEIRSLAVQFCWGDVRLRKMRELLEELPSININTPDILDKYVEIDCYSKRKHPILVGNFSAIKMGKGDLYRQLFGFLVVRNAKAKSVLGWVPVGSARDNLAKVGKWFIGL